MRKYIMILLSITLIAFSGCDTYRSNSSSSLDFIAIGQGVQLVFNDSGQEQLFNEWLKGNSQQEGAFYISIEDRDFALISLGKKEDALYYLQDLDLRNEGQTIFAEVQWEKEVIPAGKQVYQFPYVLIEVYGLEGIVDEIKAFNSYN